MKALVLCAGFGTRLRPMTFTRPKALVNIKGKPVLERIADFLNEAGIKDIAVNIHWLYPQILETFGTRFIYMYEQLPMGEEQTIFKLQPWLGDRFMVVNGDTLSNVDLKEMMKINGNVKFMHGDVYAGYRIVDVTTDEEHEYRQTDGWFRDIGTHEGLEETIKYYAGI